MGTFTLNDYTVTLLRLYNINKDESVRLAEDLDYYFLETKEKSKYLYMVNATKTDIYIIYKNSVTEWSRDKINLIISTALKKSTYMLIGVNGYHGSMEPDFWNEIKESMTYYSDVKKFRKKYIESETIIEKSDDETKPLTIDEILNKINDSGMDSLTETEKEILKNHNNG